MISIRDALPADLETITEIYNYYIRTSSATFREKELTAEEMKEVYLPAAQGFVFLVAEDEKGKAVGFAYTSKFRTGSAYKLAETTIYLAPDRIRGGIGKRLYGELIARTAKKRPDLTGLIAVITTSNTASSHFHETMKFEVVGHIRNAGCKFGAFEDVAFWLYALKPIRQK